MTAASSEEVPAMTTGWSGPPTTQAQAEAMGVPWPPTSENASSITPRAVTPGWTWIHLLGDLIEFVGGDVRNEALPGMALLGYPDGRIAFRHVCDRGDRGLIVCAPFLQLENGGHQLVARHPITITPSILCPDCGTHGFVTNGQWVAA